jgi:hypothetical protein
MRCVLCGYLESSHVERICPGFTYQEFASMSLPAGKTCADCAHSHYCDQFIGINRNLNKCDWYPIRFLEKAA